MRRSMPEPMPFLAPAARWLARLGLGLMILALVAARFGGVQPLNALLVAATGVLAALFAVLAAFGALATIWRRGAPGTALCVRALVLSALVLAGPAYHAGRALLYPPLTDISTDLSEPPSFARSRAALDARGGSVPDEYDRDRSDEQQEAYSDLQTALIEQQPQDVMPFVLQAATNLGWTIADTVNPTGRTGVGRVDAIALSTFFRLPDDITIRIRAGAGETRVDIRSRSRYGRHDFGGNAQRIRAFLRELELITSGR